MLKVENIEAFYGASQALFGMTLDCREGEVTTLLGRNGMGKTTTVNSIMGLLASQAGEIRFEDYVINGWPAYRIAKLGIGLVQHLHRVHDGVVIAVNIVGALASQQVFEQDGDECR